MLSVIFFEHTFNNLIYETESANYFLFFYDFYVIYQYGFWLVCLTFRSPRKNISRKPQPDPILIYFEYLARPKPNADRISWFFVAFRLRAHQIPIGIQFRTPRKYSQKICPVAITIGSFTRASGIFK